MGITLIVIPERGSPFCVCEVPACATGDSCGVVDPVRADRAETAVQGVQQNSLHHECLSTSSTALFKPRDVAVGYHLGPLVWCVVPAIAIDGVVILWPNNSIHL